MNGLPPVFGALVYGIGAVLLIAGVFSLAQALLARLYHEPLASGSGEEAATEAEAARHR